MDARPLESGSRFLASALHEIRTPIQTIVGTLELLSETELTQEQKEYIHQLELSSNVLLQLANNVLDFTKIRSGEIKLEKIPFDIVALCEKVCDLICIDALSKKIEIITDIDWTLPKNFLGDPTRIQQVLLNLIKNAVKFTQNGHIKIKAFKENSFLVLEVSDTGIGIPLEKQELVFKEFVQVDESTTRQFGGTGLGLAISKNLVNLMGGTIGVETNEYGGSRFFFTVPFSVAHKENPSPFLKPLKGTGASALILLQNDECAKNLHEKCVSLGFSKISVAESIPQAKVFLSGAKENNEPYTICFADDEFSEDSILQNHDSIKNLCLVIPEGKTMRTQNDFFKMRLTSPFKRDELLLLCQNLCENQNEKNHAKQSTAPQDSPAKGLHILIAEDHPMNRRLLKTMLEKQGALVHEAENGELAVQEALSHEEINLIFMDMQMPVKNGIDATAELRNKNYNGIIVACTANTDTADYDAYMQIGINDILSKPFKKEDVCKMILKWENILRSPDAKAKLSWKRITNEASALWNIEDFLDTAQNDRELAQTLVKDYIAQTTKLLESLRTELLKPEIHFGSLIQISHALKGSSASLSAHGLYETALNMEKAARNSDSVMVESYRVSFFIDFVHFQKLTEIWGAML